MLIKVIESLYYYICPKLHTERLRQRLCSVAISVSSVKECFVAAIKTIDDKTGSCFRHDGFICLPFTLTEVRTKLASSVLQRRRR